MLQTDVRYPLEVETNAIMFGFKAANLMYLKKELSNIQTAPELMSAEIKISIPELVPLSHRLIEKHLDTYADQPINWRTLFETFKNAYEEQRNKKTLEPITIQAINALQACILHCFTEHPFSDKELNELLDGRESLLFMARSTGVNEDKVDMANPGGNESEVTTAANISQALGIVIASYVGEKSLLQRLKTGDEHIIDMPVMPVLIQVLVGEGLNQPSEQTSNTTPVISGVIYTHNGAVRIQSAPGHGEYVVNSKGPTDNYYMSAEGIPYIETRSKSNRLIPTLYSTENNRNKIVLVWEENTSQAAYTSSLSPEVLRYIQIVSNKIEASYKMRMDIEFVYDPQEKILNIVQVRAIPPGDRKNLEPSAVSPRYLANATKTLKTVEGLQVITPEVNKATVITDRSQVIIRKDIKDALVEYLKISETGRDIRTVIVENYSPDTSHEAGQFNLKAIPVIRVANLKQVETMLKDADPLIIVDPQHAKVYQMDPSLKNGQKDPTLIEQDLYQNGLLEKGIFASTLSAYISPQDYHFKPETIIKEKRQLDNKHWKESLQYFKTSKLSLGKLLKLAESGEPKALHLLLSIAYEAMTYTVTPKHITQAPDTTLSQKLKLNIEALGLPKIGEDNHTCKGSLGYILRAITHSHKKRHISSRVYKQTMIAGSELAILLDRMQDPDLKQLDKKAQDALFLEYFNTRKKFESGIMGTGNKSVLAQSVITDMIEEKQQEEIQQLAKEMGMSLGDFDDRQKTILFAISKLNTQTNWQSFCLNVCTTLEDAERLSDMVTKLAKLDIHKQWLNFFFTKAYKIHNGDPTQTLNALTIDFQQLDLKSIKESQRIISELEAQVSGWADPSKFETLYKGLQENVENINRILNYNHKLSSLEKFILIQNTKQFIDVMDRTIKSLAYSGQYKKTEDDHVLRADRFRKLIATFANSMKPWLTTAYPYEPQQIDIWTTTFEASMKNTANDNIPIITSATFDVRKTIVVDKKGESFSNALKECNTLEEWFSSVHQNFVTSVDEVEKQQGLILERELYPPVFAQFEEAFMLLKGKSENMRIIGNPQNYLDEKPPHIIYSIPISTHNAMVTIFQLPQTGEFRLQYVTGSPLSEEMHRWRLIQVKSNFDLAFSGVNLRSREPFSHEPYFNSSAGFCVNLSTEVIPKILKVIEWAITESCVGSPQYNAQDEERFLFFKNLDEKELEKNHAIALELITDGYFKQSYFFNNHTDERMRNLHTLMRMEKITQPLIWKYSKPQHTEAEILKIHKFNTIKNLLDHSDEKANKAFFTLLYTHPDFDDTFCSALTGYNKTEFTVKFLSSSDNKLYRPYWIRNKLINELCNIASKSSESRDLQEITRHIIQTYPTVVPKDFSYQFEQKPEADVTMHFQDQANITRNPKSPRQS